MATYTIEVEHNGVMVKHPFVVGEIPKPVKLTIWQRIALKG